MADDPFEDLAGRLEAVGGATELVADKAAPNLLSAAQAQWAAGRAPDGSEWPALKKGSGVPLADMTSQVTAQSSGASVVLVLPEALQYHQTGTDHFPRRQLVPDDGEEPAAWVSAVDRVGEETLQQIAG